MSGNSYALRLWDKEGRVALDTSTRVLLVCGSYDIPNSVSGVFPLDGMPDGEFAYFLQPMPFTLVGNEVPIYPRVSRSGSTASWQYPSPVTGGTLKRIPCKAYYGVF